MSKHKDEASSVSASHGLSYCDERQIDDAVVLSYAQEIRICRVVAIAGDGRCVADVGFSSQTLVMEEKAGKWPKVGYFIQDSGGIIQTLFGSPSWKFVPNG